jgi:Spy/CpxP family protein refolding chaperone
MKPMLAMGIFTMSFAIACSKPALAEPPRTAPAPAQKKPAPAAAPTAAPTPSTDPAVRVPPWRARMLREDVGLDEKTADAVERILAKYRPERKATAEAIDKEQRRLNAMLELDSNDQAAYAKSIRALLDARQKLHELQRKQADELAKVLTPKQQAKLARAIGETREKMRGRRGRGPYHGQGGGRYRPG